MLLCPISLLCYVLIIALFLYKIIDIAYLMKSIYSTRYFSVLGLSGKVSVYLADSKVAFNNSLERIMEQKWITMFQSAYESWVDWRRTGFPLFTKIPTFNMTGNTIPRRLSYPQIEINVNTSSLQNGPGIPVPFRSLKSKVWWDR